MNESAFFETIREAYGSSTHNDNKFLTALLSLPWDDAFQKDNEHYFSKGAFLFVTPSLNPFAMSDKPLAVFPDGSMVEL